jgi:hypothetical protein
MSRGLVCAALLVSLTLSTGCKKQSRCEDLLPEPNAGDYRGGGTLGEDRVFDVRLGANLKEVTLSFTTQDGSRINAKYKVVKKTKKP